MLNDLSFRTVADRSAFLSSQFATNLSSLTLDSEIVRRVEDRDGDHRAETSTIFASDFRSVADGTAAGVLAVSTNVWFANIPHLWQVDASTASAGSVPPGAEGTPARKSLAFGFGVHIGVTGHDLHGLVLGPDGRLYMSFGDRGIAVTNTLGVSIQLPDTGGVLRCEPDGRSLEVFCTGLRHPLRAIWRRRSDQRSGPPHAWGPDRTSGAQCPISSWPSHPCSIPRRFCGSVQCSRCHKVGAEGGIVGPPLDHLAVRLDRRQILESILHPNAQIATGFENVLLQLRDGREVAGMVRSESPTELTVISGEDGELRIPVASITERRRTLSAMPEGLAEMLTRRQLRDLIEFLATLR